MLDGEETRIAEVDPRNDSQTQDTIARRTLIDVQYQTGVKELFNTNIIIIIIIKKVKILVTLSRQQRCRGTLHN